jgi:hypothetical protein
VIFFCISNNLFAFSIIFIFLLFCCIIEIKQKNTKNYKTQNIANGSSHFLEHYWNYVFVFNINSLSYSKQVLTKEIAHGNR